MVFHFLVTFIFDRERRLRMIKNKTLIVRMRLSLHVALFSDDQTEMKM